MTKKVISNAEQGKTQQAPHANELQPAETTELRAKVEEWLCNVTGIKSTEVAHQIWSQMLKMQVWGADLPHTQQLQLALQMIAELKPANATEALLAVQMCSVHEAALLFLRRATRKDQTEEGCDWNVLRATRLMRLFKEQLDAMMKLKGRATQQKLTVEHVHVHAGAQAVVGMVTAPQGESERG
jgi:hypothetical protein